MLWKVSSLCCGLLATCDYIIHKILVVVHIGIVHKISVVIIVQIVHLYFVVICSTLILGGYVQRMEV